MLLVYTGNGKGKTSACTGQALRAHGQGLRVYFAQFMKSDVQAGEQRLLPELLGNDHFFTGGCGFFRNEADRPKHREKALSTLAWCHSVLPAADMLIADEMLYALGQNLVMREELEALMDACVRADVHLVLSGRGLPAWLEEQADLVTEMREVKHPWQRGVTAAKGVEF